MTQSSETRRKKGRKKRNETTLLVITNGQIHFEVGHTGDCRSKWTWRRANSGVGKFQMNSGLGKFRRVSITDGPILDGPISGAGRFFGAGQFWSGSSFPEPVNFLSWPIQARVNFSECFNDGWVNSGLGPFSEWVNFFGVG